jgi:hypothetical protein
MVPESLVFMGNVSKKVQEAVGGWGGKEKQQKNKNKKQTVLKALLANLPTQY